MTEIIQKEIAKRAVIYCRVSSKEQVDEGNSLVSQERLCREYALKEGYEIVEIFIEKGESAKTADRKEWLRLTAFCEDKKNHIDAVIAYKIDRVSRNMADYLQFKVRFKKHNVTIKSVTEFFDDTPAGRFMENIIANVGQFDNDVRTERSVGGMREALLEGRYVWMAPLGYKNVRLLGKSTIEQSDKAPLMREVFELIANRTYSTDQIRLLMAAKGLTNGKGQPISQGNFYRLVRNPIYMGALSGLGVTTKGMFEPIVSEQLFTVVQRILKGRKNPTKNYLRERPDFPLRRFVQHPSGKKLTGYWSQGRHAKYPYYSFGLPNTCFPKAKIERLFLEFLEKHQYDERHLNAMKKCLEATFSKHMEKQETNKGAIEDRINVINEQVDKLVALQLAGGISLSLLSERTRKLETELDQLNDLLRLPNNKKHDIPGLMKFAAQTLTDLKSLWQTASFERRKLFQWFGFPQGIVFDGQKFRTAEIAPLFKLKELIDGKNLPVVTPRNGNKNTSPRTNMPPSDKLIYKTKEFWLGIVEELEKFQEVMNEIN